MDKSKFYETSQDCPIKALPAIMEAFQDTAFLEIPRKLADFLSGKPPTVILPEAPRKLIEDESRYICTISNTRTFGCQEVTL